MSLVALRRYLSSLRVSLPLMVAVVTLLTLVWTYYERSRRAERRVEAAAVTDLRRSMTRLQGILAHSWRAGNRVLMQEVIGELSSDPSVEVAFVADQSGRIIASTELAELGKQGAALPPRLDALHQRARRTLSGTVVVSGQGERIEGVYPMVLGMAPGSLRPGDVGVFYVRRNLGAAKSAQVGLAADELAQFAAVFFVLMLLFAYVVDRRVSRRLGALAAVTDAIAAGEVIEHVPVRGHDEIARLARAMERMVRTRREVEAALRTAQRLEAIGRLAGGVAHDFNNLLTVIIAATHMLDKKVASAHRQDLAAISEAAQRAAELTSQLLAFGRRQILQPSAVDLRQLMQRAGQLLSRLLRADIALSIAAPPDLSPIVADKTQMEQVIMNLCLNARDAMPEGGRIAMSAADVVLEPDAAARLGLEPGPYVKLSVRDSGCGMDEEIKAHIFEPFFTTKEQGEGTGLGLATVYGVVAQSGGAIDVWSELGVGTRFDLFMPPAREEGRACAKADSLAGGGGGELVVVVEDDQMVRGVVASILEQSGYQVSAVASEGEALALLPSLESPPALLVSDVVLAEGNGVHLAEQMARKHPEVPVLLMTGHTPEDIRGGLQDAQVEVLQKPFGPAELEGAVARALRRAQA